MSDRKSIDRKNLGIIGNVNAEAVAVGANSRAIVHSVSDAHGRAEFDRALEELRNQLSQLQLSETGHQVIREDVEKLKDLGAQDKAARAPAAGILENLTAKLKMVGVLVETSKPLHAPLKAIASWCGVNLPF